MIRKILTYALALGLTGFVYGAAARTPVRKHAAKRPAVRSTSKKAPAARSKSGKKVAQAKTTWRNRQLAPTPERHKEIQDALVAKGYLRADDVGTGWNQNSVDALKRFQSEQKIDSSGRINSLSLIALGLGPRRDTTPSKVAEPAPAQDR